MLILSSLFSLVSPSQTRTTWIGDTSVIWSSLFNGDTLYHLKSNQRTGEWLIYYDTAHSQKAKWINCLGPIEIQDSTWYRNGTLKSYWIDKSLPVNACYESKQWSPTGQLLLEAYCDGDTAIEIGYYPNGTIKHLYKSRRRIEINWMDVNYVVEYYQNGQPKFDPQPSLSPWYIGKCYSESGAVISEIIWTPGQVDVQHHSWYENGSWRVKGQYKVSPNVKIFDPRNCKVGMWYYYDENGKLTKEEYYEDGKLINTTQH